MGLTRRGLIGRGAAATAGLLGGALLAPRAVFAGEDGERVFDLPVPRGGGVIEARRTFELIGISGAPAGTALRARGLDGRWGEWMAVHAGHDHGPDGGSEAGGSAGGSEARGSALGSRVRGSGAALSDPIWVGPAKAFEIRAK